MNTGATSRRWVAGGLAMLIASGGCESGEPAPVAATAASAPAATAASDPAEPLDLTAEEDEATRGGHSIAELPEAPAEKSTPTSAPARRPTSKAMRSARLSPAPAPKPKNPARTQAEAVARMKDQARRSADREPMDPRHEEDDRFSELRILEKSNVKDMTFHDYGVNPTISTDEEPVSTFSVDVDSASYGVVRSFLQKGSMPDEAAVRVEEMINAFDYAYAAPEKEPFVVSAEAFPSPNRKGYHVLHVGVKGRELPPHERKPATLVFVIDVSGSMEGESRLGLVKRSLGMLTRGLDGRDTVGVVVYGSTARGVLPPTRTTPSGKLRILGAIDALATEGSTNVEAGLALGYEMAAKHVAPGATTRVVLCSDGVANVGATAAESLLAQVKKHADRGVTISTVGFGMGNYNDVLMERLADGGNGNYAYVDNLDAAQRVFVEQLGATLEVIAKDVKLQVVFDKQKVARYRLLGFENRMLDKRDFANDRVDAGEIGAGHTVTAIYEIKLRSAGEGGQLGTLRVRYKEPTGSKSALLEKGMPASIVRSSYAQASAPTKLSMVVAAFAEKLRGSYWARNHSYEDILALWDQIPETLRRRQDVAELRSLITTARSLDNRGDRFEALLPVARMDFDRVPVLY